MFLFFFFFNDTATTEIYTLSLHDALPISTVSFGFYGGFYNYYNYRYPAVYDPGYYTQDKTYFLETNLYDAETEKLLWSAQSRTYNPIDIDSFSEEFAGIIVARLKKEGLI